MAWHWLVTKTCPETMLIKLYITMSSLDHNDLIYSSKLSHDLCLNSTTIYDLTWPAISAFCNEIFVNIVLMIHRNSLMELFCHVHVEHVFLWLVCKKYVFLPLCAAKYFTSLGPIFFVFFALHPISSADIQLFCCYKAQKMFCFIWFDQQNYFTGIFCFFFKFWQIKIHIQHINLNSCFDGLVQDCSISIANALKIL